MVNNKSKIFIFVSLLFLIFNSLTISAQPNLPMEIYGSAKSFNTPVAPGTRIQAINLDGDVCGEFFVVNAGFFGTLSCLGKNTSDSFNGSVDGEVIRFRVGNFPASSLFGNTSESIGDLIWSSGSFKEVNLVAPPLVCGDGFCDSYENCNTCPEDCGACPVNPPGAGEGVSPTTPQFPNFDSFFPAPDISSPGEEEVVDECVESWVCGDWGPCTSEGIQTRTCFDENECGTEEVKPDTERSCTYNEPSNFSVNESQRPRTESPLPVETCDERLPIFGVESLLFFLIFLVIVLGPLFYLEFRKRKIRKKKLEKVDELVLIYNLENKIYTFLIIASVLAIIVYLYHYFFFLCIDVYYNNLWLLLAFILLSPIVINLLIYLLRYSERKKILLIKLLSDTHYKHLKYLITVFNKDILKSEVEITNKIYALNNRDEFYDVLAKTKEIKKIYDDLLKLYSTYMNNKESLSLEDDLLRQIESLDKNKDFNATVKDHPELASLKDNISLLYKAYDSKKELLSKLKEIEDEYDKELSSNKSDKDDKHNNIKHVDSDDNTKHDNKDDEKNEHSKQTDDEINKNIEDIKENIEGNNIDDVENVKDNNENNENDEDNDDNVTDVNVDVDKNNKEGTSDDEDNNLNKNENENSGDDSKKDDANNDVNNDAGIKDDVSSKEAVFKDDSEEHKPDNNIDDFSKNP